MNARRPGGLPRVCVACCAAGVPGAGGLGRCVCWCAAAFLLLLLVVPLVFRAPDGPAAREARRPHFVRRRASKPARALRTLRRPSHRRRLRCCVVPARPRRRPPAPRQVPLAPFGALRTGVTCVAACGSVRVVTNVVNPGAFSLIMVVFWLGLTTFVTEVLVRRFELRWFDDVCNVGRPLVARPGPVVAHQHRGRVLRRASHQWG